MTSPRLYWTHSTTPQDPPALPQASPSLFRNCPRLSRGFLDAPRVVQTVPRQRDCAPHAVRQLLFVVSLMYIITPRKYVPEPGSLHDEGLPPSNSS